MTLTTPLTPPERMAEIRRLVRKIMEHYEVHNDCRGVLPERSCGEAFDDLFRQLHRAEADGSLAECEQMLRVSHSGVL